LSATLPLGDGTFDYVFSIHALQEVPYKHVVRVLAELRRVLKPDGWLRLCLPDADKGIDAYLRRDREYFFVPNEDAASLGGKFVIHMLWYGHSRLLFTRDFIEELLLKAGFPELTSRIVRAWLLPLHDVYENPEVPTYKPFGVRSMATQGK